MLLSNQSDVSINLFSNLLIVFCLYNLFRTTLFISQFR